MEQIQKKKEIKGLYGIRAIAILGILLYHLLPEKFPGGYLGVSAFLTIMGYLMVYGVRESYGSLHFFPYAVQYYKKKAKRVYPPLLLVLIVVVLLMLLFFPFFSDELAGEMGSIIGGYHNWWQIRKNASYFVRMMNSSPFTHLWYMGLTIQYYAMWPFLLFMGKAVFVPLEFRKKGMGRAVLMVVILLLAGLSAFEMSYMYHMGDDPSRVYYGTDTRAFSLAIGMAVGLMPFEEIRKKYQKFAWVLRIIAVLALLVVGYQYCFAVGESAQNYRYGMQVNSLVFASFLVCVLADQNHLGMILDMGLLRIVGRYSYEIYLVMYPVMWFVQNQWPRLQRKENRSLYVLVCLVGVYGFVILIRGMLLFYSYVTSKERRKNHLIRRMAPVILLVCCIGLTAGQTIYCRAQQPKDAGLEQLEIQLAKREAELAKQEAKRHREAMLTHVFELHKSICELVKEAGDALLQKQLQKVNEDTVVQDESEKIAELEAAEAIATEPIDAEVSVEEQQEEIVEDTTEEVIEFQTVDSEPAPVQEETTGEDFSQVAVTCIGDSVMLGASDQLYSMIGGVYVDAKVSRQIYHGIDVVNNLAAQGFLGQVVVIHLGTNGLCNTSDYQRLIDTVGADHTIYWMTSKGASCSQQVNERIYALAEANPNVFVIDWWGYSVEHPEWFYKDNVHLREKYGAIYAEFVKEAIGR